MKSEGSEQGDSTVVEDVTDFLDVVDHEPVGALKKGPEK